MNDASLQTHKRIVDTLAVNVQAFRGLTYERGSKIVMGADEIELVKKKKSWGV